MIYLSSRIYWGQVLLPRTTPVKTEIGALETLFKALADPTRLRILGLLMDGEVCVCDIHETLGIPQAKASRHLAYLRRAGLVATRKAGLWVHYRLVASDDHVVTMILDAIRHGLGHLPTVVFDRTRLQEKTGCCVTDRLANALGFSCCTPAGSDTRTGGSKPKT